MAKDGKGLADEIFGKDGASADGEPHDDGDGAESDTGKEVAELDAAKLVMKAVQSGDVKALSEALKTHYDVCSGTGAPELDGDEGMPEKGHGLMLLMSPKK